MTFNDPSADTAAQQTILDFWFEDGLSTGWPTRDLSKLWFGGSSGADEDIKARFGEQVKTAVAGGLSDWEARPLSRMALILLLDQFTRNVFRGSGQAFAGDARAQRLTTDALAQGWDLQLPWVARVFLYLPLEHAENMALQDECVRRFELLLADAPQPLAEKLGSNADFARQHRDIIARFGRFPHRNKPLGRQSTPEEEAFLVKGPRFGQ